MDDNSLERLWSESPKEVERLVGAFTSDTWLTYKIMLITACVDAHAATRQIAEPYASLEDANLDFVRHFLNSVGDKLRELPDSPARIGVDQIPAIRTLLEIDAGLIRFYLESFRS